jgi:ABC-type nitrate/sulfonate/bicarbonate transport system ATPase subunit
MSNILIEIKQLCFSYNGEYVIENLNLDIRGGEIFVIVGPSGCGKSTLLRLIAGLEIPSRGEISIHKPENENNELRFLFQDYDAFPWYTAWENVKYSASRGYHSIDEKAAIILKRVGLWESRDKYPGELSGGMRKRLALARCLVTNPSLLLLDEPFSKLDVDTKYEMYALLQELQQEFHQTIVVVTHDLHEAILLGTRIMISAHLPLRIHALIDIPYQYPRTDLIINPQQYTEIMQQLRNGLLN